MRSLKTSWKEYSDKRGVDTLRYNMIQLSLIKEKGGRDMNKKEICNHVEKMCSADINRTGAARKIANIMYKKYNIPLDVAFELLSLKKRAFDFETPILFATIEARDEVNHTHNLDKYFNSKEIEEYSKYKFIEKEIRFPIRIKMTQVSDDQWIGRVTVKQLMEFRDAQLINYNENTQRAMTRTTVNGETVYRITINRSAIKAIRDSYNNNEYISNTITLNVGQAADLIYDQEKSELVINQLDSFDIIDGYHRYIAMSNIYNLNSDFDYNMELRIVAFSETKAKRFIWQEDQKTKMTKVQSNAMNTSGYGNKVVSLGKDRVLVVDLFSQRKINEPVMIDVIERLWFSDKKKHNMPELISISNTIYNEIEDILKIDTDLYNSEWNLNFLTILLCYIKSGYKGKELLDITNKTFGDFKKENKLDTSKSGRFLKNIIKRVLKGEGVK